jgi:predicted transcriptional regulator
MPVKFADTTLYSVYEIAHKLNVTEMSVRNYLRHGQLKGQKITGRWFITEDDLKELMKKLG